MQSKYWTTTKEEEVDVLTTGQRVDWKIVQHATQRTKTKINSCSNKEFRVGEIKMNYLDKRRKVSAGLAQPSSFTSESFGGIGSITSDQAVL